MREGSLDAPVRHPIDWQSDDYPDPAKLDAELRRVFEVCHGCRLCFNLCDSFPRLFDLIDDSPTGELDSVDSAGFTPVVEACTLCDICFMSKCPYVPPHEFAIDFPHLMLRARVADRAQGRADKWEDRLTRTDRNGRLASMVPGLANWATRRGNGITRPAMETVAGVHRDAALPKFHGKTFVARAKADAPAVNAEAPAHGRKAVLYATCFVNYNNPDIGAATRAVLAHNGVETEVVYPACCGMPQLEHGDIARVAERAQKVSAELNAWVDRGYDVIALIPSCALMLKFEWPLILPEDAGVKKLAQATFDVSEYVVDIARREGLAPGLKPLDGGVSLHLACHARAQNIGAKASEMLRLIPEAQLEVIERCSGHGGSWGVMKKNFEVALKVGRPVARKAVEGAREGKTYLASECPLAGEHIVQGIERLAEGGPMPVDQSRHPIQLLAKAYGLA
ncbi:MAG: heterodisulfide reductase-related iron-sulfur binding cluster [Alphaproteobacteria bacterium]